MASRSGKKSVRKTYSQGAVEGYTIREQFLKKAREECSFYHVGVSSKGNLFNNLKISGVSGYFAGGKKMMKYPNFVFYMDKMYPLAGEFDEVVRALQKKGINYNNQLVLDKDWFLAGERGQVTSPAYERYREMIEQNKLNQCANYGTVWSLDEVYLLHMFKSKAKWREDAEAQKEVAARTAARFGDRKAIDIFEKAVELARAHGTILNLAALSYNSNAKGFTSYKAYNLPVNALESGQPSKFAVIDTGAGFRVAIRSDRNSENYKKAQANWNLLRSSGSQYVKSVPTWNELIGGASFSEGSGRRGPGRGALNEPGNFHPGLSGRQASHGIGSGRQQQQQPQVGSGTQLPSVFSGQSSEGNVISGSSGGAGMGRSSQSRSPPKVASPPKAASPPKQPIPQQGTDVRSVGGPPFGM
jgi:hypothetical protein